jgi:hypothetical protein
MKRPSLHAFERKCMKTPIFFASSLEIRFFKCFANPRNTVVHDAKVHEANIQVGGIADHVVFKETVPRVFASDFFRESSFPKPLIIALGSFRIFSKIRGDICKSRCTTASVFDTGGNFATGVVDTGGAP